MLERDKLLKTKRFIQGNDEEDWVRVWNAEYKEYDDFRQITTEEFKIAETAPEFDPTGRFIAELDEQSVGIIHAHVDRLRKEKKGFIRSFGVIPDFRGKGIEEELVTIALNELQSRGMKIVQAWARESRRDRVRLWEKLGFELVRKFSLMERDLDNIPSGVGENKEVTLKQLRRDSDEDVKLLNRLGNECFKEHFNYRPGTLDETKYFLRKDPFFKDQSWFFTKLKGKNVGYIGVGIDEKFNVERNMQSGWILDIGVLKPQRKAGIGTRLMLQGMETLKAKGMTTAMLGVDDSNVTKAMKLYAKVGFKVTKKDLTYERNI